MTIAGNVVEAPVGGFERGLYRLVFVLVCVSVVSTLPEARELFTSGRLQSEARIDDPEFFLFRLIREGSLAVVTLYLVYGLLTRRRLLFATRTARVAALVALAALASATYSIVVKELPAIVPLFGLRIFQYTPLLLAGYAVAQRFNREGLLRFADLLRWFALLNLGLGIIQTFLASGRTTLFGVRPTGTAAGVNAFATTLVVLSLWFLVARIAHGKVHGRPKYTFWILACAAMTPLTGSRTAMTLAALTIAAMLVLKLKPRLRLAALALSPALLLGLFLAVSSPALTGRMIELSNLYRQQILRESLACFQTPADLLLGCGLGLYSTSITVIFGEDSFPGQIGNVHSTYLEILGGFGVVGLLLYVFFFVASARAGPWPEMGVLLLVVGLLGVPFSLWGFFPANALLLFLWGSLVGIGTADRRARVLEPLESIAPPIHEPAGAAIAGR